MLTKINGEVLGVADACKRVMELAAAKKPFKIEPIYDTRLEPNKEYHVHQSQKPLTGLSPTGSHST